MNQTPPPLEQATARSNITLWILLSSFLVPAILAYGYFFFGDRPNIASHGELINPIIDIHTLNITDKNGELISHQELTPKWRLYYFTDSTCDNRCIADLYNMRQINIALGKNQDRVQHVIVHLYTPDDEFIQLIESEHKQAVRAFTTTENLVPLINPLDSVSYIYLVDPLGNIMMKFSNELDPKLVLKDINKLLKLSRIG
jgi:cytochrome oxidase Cu insertion factor (SCO1/SenC/PrrC family)